MKKFKMQDITNLFYSLCNYLLEVQYNLYKVTSCSLIDILPPPMNKLWRLNDE